MTNKQVNVFMEDHTLGTKNKRSKSKLQRKTRCPWCASEGRDRAGDNLGVFDDGHEYCFACNYYNSTNSPISLLTDDELYGIYIESLESQGVPWYSKEDKGLTKGLYLGTKEPMEFTYQHLGARGIPKETMEFFDVHTKVDSSGKPVSVAFPYGSYCVVRQLDPRNFVTIGDGTDVRLFGESKFQSGSSKSITVTEGAYDAMSLYVALGSKHPVVSVRSASTAESDCIARFDYLNAFENIYVCFDNDGAGMDAARSVARLFDPNKVYHVKLDKWKDANAALQDSQEELRRTWWNAKKYQPKGVRDVFDDAKEILSGASATPSGSFPFPTLESMAYGIRPSELVLVTAQEKVGKTEFLRAIEYHLLKTTDLNLGIIHLEEQEKRSVQGLVGYSLGVPAHLPDAGVSTTDQELAINDLVKRSGRLFMHSHFGSDDPDDILGLIHYLVAVNKCKFIFLDHLTMLVTGLEGDDERRTLDYISTKLARMTRDLNFTLFLVSHVNDDGKTRGSRMPSKLCDLEVFLSRDKESSDAISRNRTNLMVRNNRFGAITGPAGSLQFDPKTFKLSELEVASVLPDTPPF